MLMDTKLDHCGEPNSDDHLEPEMIEISDDAILEKLEVTDDVEGIDLQKLNTNEIDSFSQVDFLTNTPLNEAGTSTANSSVAIKSSPSTSTSFHDSTGESSVRFSNYELSPFKEFLRLPTGVVKEKQPRRKNDIPPAVGGKKLNEYLAKKYDEKIKRELDKEERKRKREEKKTLPRTNKKKKEAKQQTRAICFDCGGTDGDDDDWIGCNFCENWYHKYFTFLCSVCEGKDE